MTSGNGVPAASDCDGGVLGVRELSPRAGGSREREASQSLRDIQNLIAKLEVVNRQLSVPLRARPMPSPEEAGDAEAVQA